jgi:Protein of unknown function (DUF1573)
MNRVICLGMAVIISTSCSVPAGEAQLAIVNPYVDLATIESDSTYGIEYKLINTGGRDLVVDTISASCGCTIPDQTQFTIRPADTASLVVSFKPPEPGPFEKKVIIRSNTDSIFTVVSFYGTAKK